MAVLSFKKNGSISYILSNGSESVYYVISDLINQSIRQDKPKLSLRTSRVGAVLPLLACLPFESTPCTFFFKRGKPDAKQQD